MRTVAFAFVALLASTGAPAQTVTDMNARQAAQYYRTGIELLGSERYEQAAAAFSSAIALDPLFTLAHYGLGQSYMALKRYASAVQAYVGCRDAYARIAAMRETNAFESNRRVDDEINYLRQQLVEVQSGRIKGAAGGPAAQSRLESKLEELQAMRRGNNNDRPQHPVPGEVLLALGSAYYRNGQAPDAEREWMAAAKASPKLGEVHNNLAVLYMQTGRKKEAEDAVRAAERGRYKVHPQLKEDIRRMQ